MLITVNPWIEAGSQIQAGFYDLHTAVVTRQLHHQFVVVSSGKHNKKEDTGSKTQGLWFQISHSSSRICTLSNIAYIVTCCHWFAVACRPNEDVPIEAGGFYSRIYGICSITGMDIGKTETFLFYLDRMISSVIYVTSNSCRLSHQSQTCSFDGVIVQ